jgi:hypothetical protein
MTISSGHSGTQHRIEKSGRSVTPNIRGNQEPFAETVQGIMRFAILVAIVFVQSFSMSLWRPDTSIW